MGPRPVVHKLLHVVVRRVVEHTVILLDQVLSKVIVVLGIGGDYVSHAVGLLLLWVVMMLIGGIVRQTSLDLHVRIPLGL